MHLQYPPICSLYLRNLVFCFFFCCFIFSLFFIAKCCVFHSLLFWNIGGTVLKNPPQQTILKEDPGSRKWHRLFPPLLLPEDLRMQSELWVMVHGVERVGRDHLMKTITHIADIPLCCFRSTAHSDICIHYGMITTMSSNHRWSQAVLTILSPAIPML